MSLHLFNIFSFLLIFYLTLSFWLFSNVADNCPAVNVLAWLVDQNSDRPGFSFLLGVRVQKSVGVLRVFDGGLGAVLSQGGAHVPQIGHVLGAARASDEFVAGRVVGQVGVGGVVQELVEGLAAAEVDARDFPDGRPIPLGAQDGGFRVAALQLGVVVDEAGGHRQVLARVRHAEKNALLFKLVHMHTVLCGGWTVLLKIKEFVQNVENKEPRALFIKHCISLDSRLRSVHRDKTHISI